MNENLAPCGSRRQVSALAAGGAVSNSSSSLPAAPALVVAGACPTTGSPTPAPAPGPDTVGGTEDFGDAGTNTSCASVKAHGTHDRRLLLEGAERGLRSSPLRACDSGPPGPPSSTGECLSASTTSPPSKRASLRARGRPSPLLALRSELCGMKLSGPGVLSVLLHQLRDVAAELPQLCVLAAVDGVALPLHEACEPCELSALCALDVPGARFPSAMLPILLVPCSPLVSRVAGSGPSGALAWLRCR